MKEKKECQTCFYLMDACQEGRTLKGMVCGWHMKVFRGETENKCPKYVKDHALITEH